MAFLLEWTVAFFARAALASSVRCPAAALSAGPVGASRYPPRPPRTGARRSWYDPGRKRRTREVSPTSRGSVNCLPRAPGGVRQTGVRIRAMPRTRQRTTSGSDPRFSSTSRSTAGVVRPRGGRLLRRRRAPRRRRPLGVRRDAGPIVATISSASGRVLAASSRIDDRRAEPEPAGLEAVVAVDERLARRRGGHARSSGQRRGERLRVGRELRRRAPP